MAPRNTPQKTDRFARTISFRDSSQSASGQWLDKYGHLHSGAIFKNWSPAAIRALGIHRVVEPDDTAGGEG